MLRKNSDTYFDMKSFFISYNRADAPWAEWIAWQLEAAGYTTVIQAWDSDAGSNYVKAMDNAIKKAERTIAVLSSDYQESGHTFAEWGAAFASDPNGEKGRLLPVRICEFKPEGLLAQIVYIDLVGLDENSARSRLLSHVQQGRKKPFLSPPFPEDSTRDALSKQPPFPGGRQTLPHSEIPPRRVGYPKSASGFWNTGFDYIKAKLLHRSEKTEHSYKPEFVNQYDMPKHIHRISSSIIDVYNDAQKRKLFEQPHILAHCIENLKTAQACSETVDKQHQFEANTEHHERVKALLLKTNDIADSILRTDDPVRLNDLVAKLRSCVLDIKRQIDS
jgi:hypothetical protein